MNNAVIVAVLYCTSMVTGFTVNERRDRPDENEYTGTIHYNTDEATVKQAITIQEQEVLLEGPGEIATVMDYNQMLMIIKLNPESKKCRAVLFNKDSVPSLEEIKALVHSQKEFEWPNSRKMQIQPAKNQSRPKLFPLSEQLCKEQTVQVYEQDSDGSINSDIGWGEVVVIIIVIILL